MLRARVSINNAVPQPSAARPPARVGGVERANLTSSQATKNLTCFVGAPPLACSAMTRRTSFSTTALTSRCSLSRAAASRSARDATCPTSRSSTCATSRSSGGSFSVSWRRASVWTGHGTRQHGGRDDQRPREQETKVRD
eukprot:5086722-Pleurochrysis_carterae.AAC.2